MSELDSRRIVLDWIYKVTGETGDSNFEIALKNGVLLCQLFNKISGLKTKINLQKSPFKIMENISAYTSHCRKIGMREGDLFSTRDLFDGTGLKHVLVNLVAYAKFVQVPYLLSLFLLFSHCSFSSLLFSYTPRWRLAFSSHQVQSLIFPFSSLITSLAVLSYCAPPTRPSFRSFSVRI